jgi:hypothetical protein
MTKLYCYCQDVPKRKWKTNIVFHGWTVYFTFLSQIVDGFFQSCVTAIMDFVPIDVVGVCVFDNGTGA